MKKLFSVFMLLAMVVAVAHSQNDAAPMLQEKENQSGAQIMFESETVDYGVIEQGSEPFRVFTFTNTGTEPLIITQAKGSCGCTVPTYPKEPIAPGETGEIKVRYDTNRLGKFTKRVTLTTNAPEEKTMLTIKGEVLKKAEEPEGLPVNEDNPFKSN